MWFLHPSLWGSSSRNLSTGNYINIQPHPATAGSDSSIQVRICSEFQSFCRSFRLSLSAIVFTALASRRHSFNSISASSSPTGWVNTLSLNCFQPHSVWTHFQIGIHLNWMSRLWRKTTRQTALNEFSGSEISICSASKLLKISSCFWHAHFPELNFFRDVSCKQLSRPPVLEKRTFFFCGVKMIWAVVVIDD